MRNNVKSLLTAAVLAVSASSALYAYAADSKSSAPSGGGMMGGMMQGGQDMSGMMNMMQQMNQMMDGCNAMMKNMSPRGGTDAPKDPQKPAPRG